MTHRDLAITRIRDRLQRRSSPRTHMLVLVTVTAACGFVSSYLLLKAGVTSMALRYPLATAIAYLAFLGLVFLWLRRFRLRARQGATERGRGSALDFDVADEIVVSNKDICIVAAPILHLGPLQRTLMNGIQRNVMGIGRDTPALDVDCSVRLFAEQPMPADVRRERSRYLGRFFRVVFREVIGSYVFKVKPKVRVSGFAAINALPAGYTTPQLQQALREAGAFAVEFV